MKLPADSLLLQLMVGQALCTLAGPADTVEDLAAAAMSAAAQALKPRPGRRAQQQQQRPPSPPRAALPAAAAASAASMLPGQPRSGAATGAAAGQESHPAAAVATSRAVPRGASAGSPQACHIPPGFGNLDGFLPPESRPAQQVGSDVYLLRSLMLAANDGMAQADAPLARRCVHVWGDASIL